MSYQRTIIKRQHRHRNRRGLAGWDPAPPELPPPPAPGSEGEDTALLRLIEAHHRQFTRHEIRLRYLQVGAILAIPLAGAVWRWILGRKHVPGSTSGT